MQFSFAGFTVVIALLGCQGFTVVIALLGCQGFTVVIALLGCQVDADCPTGWTRFDRSCYRLFNEAESWIGAYKLCEHFNSYLIEVNDEKENTFFFNFTSSVSDYVWIGATDLDIEGEWIWANSEQVLTFTKWKPNEPNNSNLDENCMQLDPKGMWNDGPCHGNYRFVCEKPYTDPSSIVG